MDELELLNDLVKQNMSLAISIQTLMNQKESSKNAECCRTQFLNHYAWVSYCIFEKKVDRKDALAMFGTDIISAYDTFEKHIGGYNNLIRMALTLKKELGED